MIKGRLIFRGAIAFVVFFVAYFVAGVLINFGILVLTAGGLSDVFWELVSAAFIGFWAPILAIAILGAVMKNYPAKGIAVAFTVYLTVTYLKNFVFYYGPDDEFTGLGTRSFVQSVVAIGASWFLLGAKRGPIPDSN
jgi:hypothetical protein